MTTAACLVLGIDLGTSGVRVAVINQKQQLIHTASATYPHGLGCPEDWRSCCSSLIRALPAEIRCQLKAIAVDGTSGTLLACNQRGEPLAAALPYNLACPEQKERLTELVACGSAAASVSSSLARALRLTEQLGYELLLRHQADWISGWLLNDWSDAEEGNNLRLGWNLNDGNWPDSFSSLPWRGALPQIVASGRILGSVDQTQAAALDLPQDLRVVAGTTDANAAVLAADAGPKDGITVLGSTLVLKRFVEAPLQGAGITNHRVGGGWLSGGASNAGCAVLRQLFSDGELQELSRQINPEQSSGLKLRPLPAIGERFPIDDPSLQPVLEPRPVSDALYLHGLLEGLARIEAEGWQRLMELGAPPAERLITLGGGARNPQWRRIRERLIGLPIVSRTTPPAAGVARLALRAVATANALGHDAKESNHLP
ncbi:MAG: FGGY-family carbohydrate kinase [Prochlorococcus sp.]